MSRDMHMSARRGQGFTLLEVLIAVVVIAVGMLGIAKVQALVLSNTGVSRTRALAAIEAASLAAAMHADRSYWSSATVAPAAGASAGAASSSDAGLGQALALAVGSTCVGGGSCLCVFGQPRCTAVNLAGNDLVTWANDLNSVLPSATAAIACNPANVPVDCTITLSWVENLVAVNNQGANGAATLQNAQYTLYVVP